jgi:hypothetical protein
VKLNPAHFRHLAVTLRVTEENLAELERLLRARPRQRHRRSLRQTLVGTLSTCWMHFEETKAKNLRAYGHVDPNAACVLDSLIDHIAEPPEEIRSTLTRPPTF